MNNSTFVMPEAYDVVLFRVHFDRDALEPTQLWQESIISRISPMNGDVAFETENFQFTVSMEKDGTLVPSIASALDDSDKTAEIIELWRRTSADVMTCVYRQHKPVINDIETFAETFRRYD